MVVVKDEVNKEPENEADDKELLNNPKPFVLGTELRDAIAASITRCLPNIKWKELTRLVNEFEVELSNLNTLQENE